jgi:thiol-disulfide isomerase/thioredoxin
MDGFFCSLIIIFLSISMPAWPMGQVPSETVHSSLIGKPAPDAVLVKSDGTSGKVVDSRRGQKAILVFWATWCPHCYEDLGTINATIGPAARDGIKIILVDVGETPEAVKNYFKQRQMGMVSFVDVDSSLQGPYRLIGVPTLVFIDEKGIVRNITHQFPSDYKDLF